MAKFITIEEAVAQIPDGASIMFGGYLGCGNPHRIINALAKSGRRDLTIIGNDAAMPGGYLGEAYYGVAKLVHNRQVKKVIASHVGSNPEVAQQMNCGELEVMLVPQGNLAEMIRAGGFGLGGVLTPTGVGTVVEYMEHVAGKIEIDGKWYLIERPLRADFAILSGYKVDRAGNVWYKGTTRSFGVAMASAADVVIVEADYVVEVGEIEAENVMTPGIFVDYVVDGGGAYGKR
jgi:acetate CoA/acetoacetate CoA-transferase alpha subunit